MQTFWLRVLLTRSSGLAPPRCPAEVNDLVIWAWAVAKASTLQTFCLRNTGQRQPFSFSILSPPIEVFQRKRSVCWASPEEKAICEFSGYGPRSCVIGYCRVCYHVYRSQIGYLNSSTRSELPSYVIGIRPMLRSFTPKTVKSTPTLPK